MDTSKRHLAISTLSRRSRTIGLVAAAGGPATGTATLTITGLRQPATTTWDVGS